MGARLATADGRPALGSGAPDPRRRLNAICPYYTMFPLDFPLELLRGTPRGAWVLDPFCGRGTTVFGARMAGLAAVGVDSNPVAVAITAAKLASATADEVLERLDDLLAAPAPADVPDGPFWRGCFHPATLRELCTVREGLLASVRGAEDGAGAGAMLRAIVLRILHGPRNKGAPTYLSNQMPRTFATKPEPAVRFWSARGMVPARISVRDVVHRRSRHVLRELPPATGGAAVLADSAALDFTTLGARFDWVITSPPYPGMRTYRPDQWLRGWLLGGPAHVDYGADAQLGADRSYAAALGRVWRNVAEACRPGARLAVRLGALPSAPCDPEALLREALAGADAGWRIARVRPAGTSQLGRRQAAQFRRPAGPAIEEIDLLARLEE